VCRFWAVDILTAPLNDAYFFLGQTYCQKYNGMYCTDYVFSNPEPSCDEVETWGCCASTMLDLEQHCDNPANEIVGDANARCPTATSWTAKKCGGAAASKCCGADMTTYCSLSSAAGVLPSVTLALALFATLYMS